MRDALTHLERAVDMLKYISMELKQAEDSGAEINCKPEFHDFCSSLSADFEDFVEVNSPPFKPSGDSRYV